MSWTISKNFALIAASNLLAPIFSLVLVLSISHLQGVEMLGKYSLLTTVFVLGGSIAGFGLPVVITREVARAPEEAWRYVSSSIVLATGLSLPLLAAGAIACWREEGDPQLALALALSASAVLPSIVTQCAEAALLAFERARDFVTINLTETLARAVLGTGLVLGGFGLVALATLFLLLRVVAALAFLATLRRRGVRPRVAVDWPLCRRLAGYVPVTGLIPLVNAVYSRADVLLLSSLGSWRDVGLYGAALRLVDLGRSVPPAYARASYPALARARAEGGAGFSITARRATVNGVLIAVPIALVLSGAAEPIIALLYGPELAGAAEVLRLLAFAVLPMALAVVLAQVLFAADRQAVDLVVNVLSMVVSVAMAFLLVGRFGALGAAIATVSASGVYAVLQYAGVARWVAPPDSGPALARVAACVGLALLALRALAPLGQILSTAGALVTFAGAAAALDLVRPRDLFWRSERAARASADAGRVAP